MTEIIGYLSALAFILSGIPIAYGAVRAGRTDISIAGCLLVVSGSVGTFLYVILTSRSTPLLINYAVNFLCWSTILKYRLFPRTYLH